MSECSFKKADLTCSIWDRKGKVCRSNPVDTAPSQGQDSNTKKPKKWNFYLKDERLITQLHQWISHP